MASSESTGSLPDTTYGLLCDRAGCPVAIEVFEGNATDPTTVGRQTDKFRRRVGLGRVALAGDRGMAASARIREELDPAGLDRISALKSTDIRKLVKGPLTAEVPVPNAVAEVAGRLKISKHFEIRCEDDGLSWRRRQERIDREAALDGICVVRTSLDADSIVPDEAVEACKTGRLRVRPIFVYSETHVFLCMLANHAEWHMRRRLAPLLFDEDDPEAARAQRASPVEPAKPSPSARSKAVRKRTQAEKPRAAFTACSPTSRPSP